AEGVIGFEDDGPDSVLVLKQDASVVVDETLGANLGETEGGASGLGSRTVLGSTLFDTTGSTFGQDEEGASAAFSLQIAGDGRTGLYATGAAHVPANEIIL